jgi:hypothetical protein
MRGITSLIDTGMEDSSQLLDENLIISSEPDHQSPKKKSTRPKDGDAPAPKPKAASRKANLDNKPGPKKAPTRSTATKRKAMDDKIQGESQTTKKSFTAPTTQLEDDIAGIAGEPEARHVAKPKAKRKAKAKEALEYVDASEITSARAHPASSQLEVEKAEVIRESGDRDDEVMANTPQRPTWKAAPAASHCPKESRTTKLAGNASDGERMGGDPSLRRKLGDVTRKFENIDLKYRNLKDVGIVEANANMDKIRKQCEITTSASNELIASLKKELAIQMPLAQEARQLQNEMQKLQKEAVERRSTVTDLESSLATAQNETRALQARLAAARSSTTAVEIAGAKTPGSVIKNTGPVRTVMVGSAEAAQSAQTAQLKEDLYSDLTGLIIRGVKRTGDGDAYDCIQTGRNGSKWLLNNVFSSRTRF